MCYVRAAFGFPAVANLVKRTPRPRSPAEERVDAGEGRGPAGWLAPATCTLGTGGEPFPR